MEIKLLRVIRSIDKMNGGPIEGIRQITPHLNDRNIRTTVVSLDSPYTNNEQVEPFIVKKIGPVYGKYGYKRKLISQIKELALESDVIIIHGIWQYHSFATREALKGLNKPYFVYPHGMLDPWFKIKYPMKHIKKQLYWWLAEYYVLKDAESVLFTAEREKELARESFTQYNVSEKVVAYGTSEPPHDKEKQKDAFLKNYPNLQGKRIFLFLGRIHEKKGIDLLINAFAKTMSRIENTTLVIAGPHNDDYKKKMEQLITKLNVSEKVIWTGMLVGDMKWGAFRSAELFCLPSHQENFGIAVAEALACGLPVSIAKPVNISNEILTGNAGIIHEDDITGTIHALNEWIKMTSVDKQAMQKNAKKLFEDKYNCTRVASEIHKLLADTVQKKGV